MGLFRPKNKNFIVFPHKFVFVIFWEIKCSSPKIKKKKFRTELSELKK